MDYFNSESQTVRNDVSSVIVYSTVRSGMNFIIQKLYNIIMSFSLIYLVQRFFYRIYDFLRHWYIGGFLRVIHQTLNFLEFLDRRFALKITLRYLFRPLYQDYTVLGYILGFIFRSARILAASFVYFIVVLAALAIYLAWAAIPVYLVYKIFAY